MKRTPRVLGHPCPAHAPWRRTAAAGALLAALAPSLAWAGVTCGGGGVANAIDTGFGASASIPVLPGFAVTAPLPPGCNGATFASGKNSGFWGMAYANVAAGGDVTDWTKSWVNGFGYGSVALDPPADLVVTPVSPVASTSLGVSGVAVSATQAVFTVNWSGSDAGTAQQLTWYEYDGSIPTGFTGPVTGLPQWSQLSHQLDVRTRNGPWSETLTVSITALDVNHILLVADGVAASVVPEPAAGWLAAAGLGVVGWRGLRRRRV